MYQIRERLLILFGHIDGQLVDVAKNLVGLVAVVELHFAHLGRLGRRRLEESSGRLRLLQAIIVVVVVVVAVAVVVLMVMTAIQSVIGRLRNLAGRDLERRAELVGQSFNCFELLQLGTDLALLPLMDGEHGRSLER